MRIVVITHSISPYQAELFNEVASSGDVELKVVYLHRSDPTRRWVTPPIVHRAVCLDEEPDRFEEARADMLAADLTVFNYYAEHHASVFLNARAASGNPWCFWGERPGFRKPEWIGRLVRRYSLSRL